MEYIWNTDPNDSDTDGDGFDDDVDDLPLDDTDHIDTDGDGIGNTLDLDDDNDDMDDIWEDANGLASLVYERNGDPDQDEITNIQEYSLSLAGWGNSPIIYDIFIEVDWMIGFAPVGVRGIDVVGHNTHTVFHSVVQRYLNHNIQLHIDDGWAGGNGNGFTQPATFEFDPLVGPDNDFFDFKAVHKSSGGLFHYSIFGDLLTNAPGVGGRSEGIPSDDFFIAQGVLLGAGYTNIEIASVFMHELGHNMGLHHYGGADVCPHGDGPVCPQYVSIMSYFYTAPQSQWPAPWGGNPDYGFHPGPDGIPGNGDDWIDWDHIDFTGI